MAVLVTCLISWIVVPRVIWVHESMLLIFTCFSEVTFACGGGEQRLTAVSHGSSTWCPNASNTWGGDSEEIERVGDHMHGLSRSCLRALHQGRAADPAAMRLCCQSHLCCSYPLSSGWSRASEGNVLAVGLHAVFLNHGGKKPNGFFRCVSFRCLLLNHTL